MHQDVDDYRKHEGKEGGPDAPVPGDELLSRKKAYGTRPTMRPTNPVTKRATRKFSKIAAQKPEWSCCAQN